MSANNDNAMTRFLFAILKQKCLKDIDWNQVAHDPILAQEITNGHAARMRYSRFRAAMLGLEPQRRNKTNANKSKVTKSKKEPKAKKEDTIKPDPGSETASIRSMPEASSPGVKQEPSIVSHDTLQSQLAFPGMSMAGAHIHPHNRLLTPCSDTDILSGSGGYAPSPSGDMVHSEPSFDFSPSAPCDHEQAMWSQNGPYSAFTMPYSLEGYPIGLCEQPHTHQPEGICMPDEVMHAGPSHQTNIKQENWDTPFR